MAFHHDCHFMKMVITNTLFYNHKMMPFQQSDQFPYWFTYFYSINFHSKSIL